ncbi:MAG: hypothetical protein RBS29_09395, partial [Bacteroidales bacterium]|nr:hypothetical protein [Bacteroidales bacterium]
MEKEFDIFGNTELHDRAVRELYNGSDINDPRLHKQFSKYIFYDVLTPENEIVPTALVLSCSGEKEDILKVLDYEILSMLSKNQETQQTEDTVSDEYSHSMFSPLMKDIDSKLRDRLGNVDKVTFIKNISTKDGYTDPKHRISRVVKEIMEDGDSNTAIYIAETGNDAIVFMENDFEMDLIEGG